MVTIPTNARNSIKVSYVVTVVFLLHVAATILAILREAHYKGWIYRVNPKDFGFLNPEDVTDRLSRNVDKKLPLLAA
jgi:hypothetical protein